VRAFVSPAWTLEFELASSGLYRQTFQAFLEAKAIKNSATEELTLRQRVRIRAEGKGLMEKANALSRSVVARQLTEDLKRLQVSKAVMAQCLACNLLKLDGEGLAECLLKSKVLRYLVDAIQYATGAEPRDSPDKQ
jgi:hypothetical protein